MGNQAAMWGCREVNSRADCPRIFLMGVPPSKHVDWHAGCVSYTACRLWHGSAANQERVRPWQGSRAGMTVDPPDVSRGWSYVWLIALLDGGGSVDAKVGIFCAVNLHFSRW